jgi:hypothetical protein
MSRAGGRIRAACAAAGLALLGGGWSGPVAAQELADFDYENLAFRGLGAEVGRIWPTRVDPTTSYGVRMDLGYLGPGLRVTPSITYWSSRMRRSEVRELEQRVEELVDREAPPGAPPASVSLGTIDWSDLVLSLDAHVVWRVPFGMLTFAGAGASAHVLNGGGEAVEGTFIEDLLDTVTAGANVHLGLEYPVGGRFRLYGLSRLEMAETFQYLELRFGGQLMFGSAAPGEVRR